MLDNPASLRSGFGHVTALADFTGAGLIKRLRVGPQRRDEQAMLRHLFSCCARQMATQFHGPAKKCEAAFQMALEHALPRLEFWDLYEQVDLSSDLDYPREAMLLALLCGDHLLADAVQPVIPGVPPATVADGIFIWDTARLLREGNIFHSEAEQPEALFVARLDALAQLHQHEDVWHDMDPADQDDFITRDLPTMMHLCHGDGSLAARLDRTVREWKSNLGLADHAAAADFPGLTP